VLCERGFSINCERGVRGRCDAFAAHCISRARFLQSAGDFAPPLPLSGPKMISLDNLDAQSENGSDNTSEMRDPAQKEVKP